MYTVHDYGRMMLDEVRMAAYLAALDRLVRPGSVVIDVGCGTGVFTLYACKLGARLVHAIDPNPAIELVAPMAAENGWSDRIVIHRGTTDAVELAERGDVIVWDVRDQLALIGVESMIDARRRFLAPGGALVPRRDRMMAALVESSDLYEVLVGAWRDERFGFSQRAAKESVLNSAHHDRPAPLKAESIVSEPREWAVLDFTTAETGSLSGEVRAPIVRDGTAHAIAVWFETELADGIGFSTAPAPTSLVYARLILPLLEPQDVRSGDEARVALSALPSVSGYVWSWNTELSRGDRRYAAFQQSTFFSEPLTAGELRRTSPDYRPRINAVGEGDRLVLSLFDGRHSINEIATRLAEHQPDRFRTPSSALAEVKRLAQKLGR